MKTEDVPYAEIGDTTLLMRIYTPDNPIGHGIVMVHGGAWTANDRMTPHVLNEAMAKRGLLVASLDFRCGPYFQHPTASADIAAGVRYLRGNAGSRGINPDSIGLIGSSSGGHLALFTSLQPDISIHQETPFRGSDPNGGISAQVAYVIALWPVSDPLYRYHYAIKTQRSDLIAAHDGFFEFEDRMEQASVPRLLREQENTHLPPAFVVQPGEDKNVPQEMTLNLIREYQRANGNIHYRFMPGLPHAFAYQASDATTECEQYIWQFIQNQIG